MDADIISHLTGFQDTAASSRGRYRPRGDAREKEKKKKNVIWHY